MLALPSADSAAGPAAIIVASTVNQVQSSSFDLEAFEGLHDSFWSRKALSGSSTGTSCCEMLISLMSHLHDVLTQILADIQTCPSIATGCLCNRTGGQAA